MNHGPGTVLLEVCVGSIADIEAAVAAGADRVELCSALELGGLTPSIGLVERAIEVASVPIIVMLRPRAGGFCYDQHEFAGMLADAERFLDLGASGFAFGILDGGGKVDTARVREVVELVGSAESVFHRAFDFVSDKSAAMDQLAEAGCGRILTSGGKPTAAEGARAIRELIAHAVGRIEVLPAGGIRADNVVDLVRHAGCSQVHMGAGMEVDDHSISESRQVELCDARFTSGYSHRIVNQESVAAAIAALRRERLRP
jgi:copper homeostasis protein